MLLLPSCPAALCSNYSLGPVLFPFSSLGRKKKSVNMATWNVVMMSEKHGRNGTYLKFNIFEISSRGFVLFVLFLISNPKFLHYFVHRCFVFVGYFRKT